VQRVRHVLALVTQCNEAGKTSTCGIEFFKPTTRLMIAFNELPWIFPTNQSLFGNVIDCFYFIFYEGAGRDKLRFLNTYGGPLTEADCEFIWCIKHLRNKWIRHDADHGDIGDIRKSWADLAAMFRWLGLTEFPTDVRHYQYLYHQLIVQAENFLKRILDNLKLN
jgi:hypothetical protein